MHELIEAICKLLAEAGVTVVRQFYPGAAPELDAPVTAVGLQGAKSARRRSFRIWDAGGRGRRAHGAVWLRAVGGNFDADLCTAARRSAACYAETEKVVAALSGGAAGVQLAGITVGACEYDAQSDASSAGARAGAGVCIRRDGRGRDGIYGLYSEGSGQMSITYHERPAFTPTMMRRASWQSGRCSA